MPADKTDLTDLTPRQGEGGGNPATESDDKSVKSVKSGKGVTGGRDTAQRPDGLAPDAGEYLDFLQRNGPSSYGAAAVALGWGATRAWATEARLEAAGLVRYGIHGKTYLATDRRALSQ